MHTKIHKIKMVDDAPFASHTKIHKIKIFEDKAGNKLFKKWIKTRGTWQWTVTNREGKLVDLQGVKSIMDKAKRSGYLPKKKITFMKQIKIKSNK
jgi:hypothetical protein